MLFRSQPPHRSSRPAPALSLKSSCRTSNPQAPSCLCPDQLPPDLCKAQPPTSFQAPLKCSSMTEEATRGHSKGKNLFVSVFSVSFYSCTFLHPAVFVVPLSVSFPAPPPWKLRATPDSQSLEKFWHRVGTQDINRKKNFLKSWKHVLRQSPGLPWWRSG